ncbi:MAG: TIGR02217 family protein, partial [Alphaproteobacteria bacterium]
VEGVDWEVDVTTGVITFTTAPGDGAEVTAGFEFDVPVRFDTDRISVSVARFRAGEVPSVPVVEIRL